MNNTKLSYSGAVSITLGKKRLTAFNNGTKELFRFFANALLGNNVSDAAPNIFKIQYNSSEGTPLVVQIQRADLVEEKARFGGYITTALPSDTSTCTLQLCKDDNIVYASVNLTDDQLDTLKTINAEKSALIEWELQVSNIEGENN